MSLDLSQRGGAGGMIMGASEDKKRSLQVVVIGESSGNTTFTVTYGRKR